MNERLEQLAIAAREQDSQSNEGQRVLAQLVDEILRSRPICRPASGQPLSSVQKNLYERIRQQLLHEVPQELDRYNPKHTTVREWANSLRDRTFKTILNDEQLKQLAIEIQQYPPDSLLRRHLLGELVEAIRRSGKLCRPHREKFSPQFYDLLYEEAVVKTLTYVCKNIEKYDPQRGQNKKFMNWVNFRLDRVIVECRREFNDPMFEELPSLADLENMPQEQEPSLFEKTCEYIAADPDNVLKQEHIRNRADVTFQAIALARFSGKSWEEISAMYGIKVPTLSSFFQRCCSKFRSQFQEKVSLI